MFAISVSLEVKDTRDPLFIIVLYNIDIRISKNHQNNSVNAYSSISTIRTRAKRFNELAFDL